MVHAYQTLEVNQRASVVEVTINNPPLNVMTLQLYSDLVEFTEKVEHDDSVKVIIFQSANPDFFIAHFDVEAILEFPTDSPAKRSEKLSDFHLMCERVRTMPKATIGILNFLLIASNIPPFAAPSYFVIFIPVIGDIFLNSST